MLASTSIGQEGLDFHNYCRRIVHWNLPSNPIDLEQREEESIALSVWQYDRISPNVMKYQFL